LLRLILIGTKEKKYEIRRGDDYTRRKVRALMREKARFGSETQNEVLTPEKSRASSVSSCSEVI
jgi:hypothetical protein